MEQNKPQQYKHHQLGQKSIYSQQTQVQITQQESQKKENIQKQTFKLFGMTIRNYVYYSKKAYIFKFYQTIKIKSNRTLYNFMLVHSTDRMPNNRNFRNIYSTNIIHKDRDDDIIQQWPFIQDDQNNFSQEISLKDKFCLMFSLKEPGREDQQQYRTAIDRQFQINASRDLQNPDNEIKIQIQIQGQGKNKKIKCEITFNKDSQKQQQLKIFTAFSQKDCSDRFNIYLKEQNQIQSNYQIQRQLLSLEKFTDSQGDQSQFQTKHFWDQYKKILTFIRKQKYQMTINIQDKYSPNAIKKLVNFLKAQYRNRNSIPQVGDSLDYQLYQNMYRTAITRTDYERSPPLVHHISNRALYPHFLLNGLHRGREYHSDKNSVKNILKSIKAPDNIVENTWGLPCYLLQGGIGDCSIIAIQNQILMVEGSYYEKIVPFQSDNPSHMCMNINQDGQIICLSTDTGIPDQMVTKQYKTFFETWIKNFEDTQGYMSASYQYKGYKGPQHQLLQKRIQRAILFESIQAQYYSSYFKLVASTPQQIFMNITNHPCKRYELSVQQDLSILKTYLKSWKNNFTDPTKQNKILITISIGKLSQKIEKNEQFLKKWDYRKLEDFDEHTYSFCGYYEDETNSNSQKFTPFFILSKSHQNSALQWNKIESKQKSSQYSLNFKRWAQHLKDSIGIDHQKYLNNDQFLVQLSFLKALNAIAFVCQVNLQNKYYSRQMIMYDGWYNQILFDVPSEQQYTLIFHRPNSRNGITIQKKNPKQIQDEVVDQLNNYRYSQCSIVLYDIDSKKILQQHGNSNQITVINHNKFKGHYRLLIGQRQPKFNQMDEIFYAEDKLARVCVLSISGRNIEKSYFKFNLRQRISQIEDYSIESDQLRPVFPSDKFNCKPKRIIYKANKNRDFFAFVMKLQMKTAMDPNELVKIQIFEQNKLIPENSKLEMQNLFGVNKFKKIFPFYFPKQIHRNDCFKMNIEVQPLFFENLCQEGSSISIQLVEQNSLSKLKEYIIDIEHQKPLIKLAQ